MGYVTRAINYASLSSSLYIDCELEAELPTAGIFEGEVAHSANNGGKWWRYTSSVWVEQASQTAVNTPTHIHAAADSTSGVFAMARLATGTPTGSKFVRDDGTLQVPPGTGGTPASTVTSETTYGVASAVGTGTDYARNDHTHGSPSLGTSGTTACVGNDSRLSDARTPTTHATSHKTGGSDAIKLDELAAPTDVTTLNASTSAHGLLKKLSNVSTEFLNGEGNFAVPAGGSGASLGLVNASALNLNLP